MRKMKFQNILNMTPFLIIKDNIVVEVNKFFLNLTGYIKEEILYKSIEEIFDKLRLTPKLDLDNLSYNKECFIFTKTFEYRDIKIKIQILPNDEGVKVFFMEKKGSRFEESFKFLNSLSEQDITAFAVYTVPDFVLLKASDLYLRFFNEPFDSIENSYGKSKDTFFLNWRGSEKEAAWKNIVDTGRALHVREYKIEDTKRGTTYWDCIVTPIFENGSIRCLVANCVDVTEKVIYRQKVEKQNTVIYQQKKQLETIIENISDGIFILDENKHFTLLNEGAREFFYKSEKVEKLGDTFRETEYYDAEGNLVQLNSVPKRKIINGECAKGSRVTLKRPDGVFHFEISGHSITDENGKTTMKIFCTRNITEKVKHEELISEQKKELETIIENISDHLYIIDKNRRFIRLNKCLIRELGDVEINNVGDFFKRFKYYDINGHYCKLEQLPSTRVIKGEKVENEIFIQKGRTTRYLNINANPVFDDKGDFIMGIIFAKDITSDVLHKQAIERQAHMLYKLIHNLDLPLLRLSYPDLMITDINQGAYKIIKALKPEMKSIGYVMGKKYSHIIPNFDEDNMHNEIEKVLNKQETSYVQYKRLMLQGEETFVNALYQPLFGVKGEIEEIVAVIIDVTKERRAKQKVEKSLKMQEELFANISHELKTPLNVIYSTAQLFNSYCKNDSLYDNKQNIIKYLDTITRNCYRLSKLVNNIVDISKIDAGFYDINKSNYNIVSVVEDMVMSIVEYPKSRGLDIIFDTNTEEKIIACDPIQIERVILNLISNAIKFSDVGGVIFINFCDNGEYVDICVEDTGIGIDKSQIPQIFDRFKQVDKSFSRKAEGSGIGLSLVKSIVELHGGKVFAESEVGKGSKFTVRLPAKKIENKKYQGEYSSLENISENICIEFSDIY